MIDDIKNKVFKIQIIKEDDDMGEARRKKLSGYDATQDVKILYHYTSVEQLPWIGYSGYLKLTSSDLIMPDETIETELKNKVYRPVVWLTDSLSAEKMGLDGSLYNKKAVRITIQGKPDIVKWEYWEPIKEMKPEWKRAYCKDRNWKSWYVSEQIITFEDILKVENILDGTIYFERVDGKITVYNFPLK